MQGFASDPYGQGRSPYLLDPYMAAAAADARARQQSLGGPQVGGGPLNTTTTGSYGPPSTSSSQLPMGGPGMGPAFDPIRELSPLEYPPASRVRN